MERNLDSVLRSPQRSSSTNLRFASFALMLLAIVALGAVAYFTERGIAVNRDWVIHTYQVRTQLNDLELEIMRLHAGEGTFLKTEEEGKLLVSQEHADLARQTVDALRTLTRDNPRQQARLEELNRKLQDDVSLIRSQAASKRSRIALSPSARRREEQILSRQQQVNSIVRNMQDEEESLLEERLRAWDYLFRRNVLMLGIAFVIVTLLLGYNFRLLLAEVARTKDTEKRERDNAESYRLMSARILELQDLERRRIARELHDSVGQYLAGLKINLSQLENGTPVDAPAMIRETLGLTDYAIQEVRTISHLLHPPLLEELGFLPAARWYVDEYGKRSQVSVSLLVSESMERLPREVEIALFRVLQESLTNVYRHAAANAVDVRLVHRDGYVVLTIADDGKGIPQEILAKFRDGAAPGIGLAGMRERLAEFGGQMKVESSRTGSIIEAMIPTHASDPMKKAPSDPLVI